jgi:hypothetical protein
LAFSPFVTLSCGMTLIGFLSHFRGVGHHLGRALFRSVSGLQCSARCFVLLFQKLSLLGSHEKSDKFFRF